MKAAFWLAPLLLVAGTLVAFAPQARKAYRADQALAQRLAAVQPAQPKPVGPCTVDSIAKPLVLLVLGQSNAGNHGQDAEPPVHRQAQKAHVFVGEGCQSATDPLPGATGNGASIWSRLPAHLQRLGVQRPVVLAILAVDASSIAEWTDSPSALKLRLDKVLDQLGQAQLVPDFVLWQQGEADAKLGTSTVTYADAFAQLRQRIRAAGVNGPLLLARSTMCHGADGRLVRAALEQLAAQHQDVRLGPDTDLLAGSHRHAGCHFSDSGLDAAALMWAQAIAASRPQTAP
jgi:hypothetical protein